MTEPSDTPLEQKQRMRAALDVLQQLLLPSAPALRRSCDHIRDATKKVQKMAGNGMSLIDEIEAAAKRGRKPRNNEHPVDSIDIEAAAFVAGPYWKRLVAALEAGQEMAKYLDAEGTSIGDDLAAKFRDAMK